MSRDMGQMYFERFQAWATSLSDDDFRQIVYAPKGILNRQEIRKLSGISEQAIKKNPNIKEALRSLEDQLRDRGVLPPLTETGREAQIGPKLYDKTANQATRDSKHVAQLELSNYDLKVRIAEFEKEVEELRSQLASSKESIEAVKDGLTVFTLCPSN